MGQVFLYFYTAVDVVIVRWSVCKMLKIAVAAKKWRNVKNLCQVMQFPGKSRQLHEA